jgi:hypothetical protein
VQLKTNERVTTASGTLYMLPANHKVQFGDDNHFSVTRPTHTTASGATTTLAAQTGVDNGGGAGGAGGTLQLQAGTAGSSGSSGASGGDVEITPGAGSGDGVGGFLKLGHDQHLTITRPQQSAGTNGANTVLTGQAGKADGAGSGGIGGKVVIVGGSAGSSGGAGGAQGGQVDIQPGTPTGTGANGEVHIKDSAGTTRMELDTTGRILFSASHADGLQFTANRKITTDSDDLTVAPGTTGKLVLTSADSTNGVQLTTNRKITTDTGDLTVHPGTSGKIVFNPTNAAGLQFTANRKISTDTSTLTLAPASDELHLGDQDAFLLTRPPNSATNGAATTVTAQQGGLRYLGGALNLNAGAGGAGVAGGGPGGVGGVLTNRVAYATWEVHST